MNKISKKFVRVIIEDELGRVLMVSQKSSGSLVWNFPGGKVESGESPTKAALREVYEETGLELKYLDYICEDFFKFDNLVWTGYFFKGYSDCFDVKNMEPLKLQSVGFYDWENFINKKVFSAEIYNQVAKKKIDDIYYQMRLNLWNPSENVLSHFG